MRTQSPRHSWGVWHEVYPIIVELTPGERGALMLCVSSSDWVRSLDDLVAGEWVGPLTSSS